MEPTTPKSLPTVPQAKSPRSAMQVENIHVDTLSIDNVAALKQALALYDNQEVHLDNVHVVLQSLGVVVTGPELTKLKEILSMGATSNGTIHFQKLLATIDKHLNEGFTLPEQDVMDAFKLFDKGNTGSVDVANLKPYLLTLGKLTEREVDEMLAVADPQRTGKIKYYSFVKTLFQ